jgi:hypothetical protein
MVLEATMIVCDNSDVRACSPTFGARGAQAEGRRVSFVRAQWMRNGDFAPSRLESQQDAVNLLAGAKTQSNPENTVGVLTMAGAGVEVRVAMTPDVGRVLAQSVRAVPRASLPRASRRLIIQRAALRLRLANVRTCGASVACAERNGARA